METNTEDKRQSLDLQFLEGVLNDNGVRTHFAEKSEEYALSFLTMEIPAEVIPQEAYVQIMYIPSTVFFDETNLLQLFAYLPEELPEDSKDVDPILRFLNTRTPFGYFAKAEDEKVFYRYVYAMSRFNVPGKEQFWEVIDLFSRTFAMYGSVITRFAKGEISIEEAKAEIA